MGQQVAAPKKEPDRVDLRLFNTIIIFDVYTIARSGEAAREALIELIKTAQIEPTEAVAKESTMANSIRASQADVSPLVAVDVTDEEFEQLKGITNAQAFERFYKKAKK
jgi:hypothetical protein